MLKYFKVAFKYFKSCCFMNLKTFLKKENKKRWLDIGNGANFEPGFYYLDTFPLDYFPPHVLNPLIKKRYFRLDILNVPDEEFQKLGKFDFIRMQHTFEHFTYEEGKIVLKNCAKLLNQGGYILITVPDLKIHIQKYLNDEYRKWEGFKWWANKRVAENAPNSFYFSIFAHSMPFEAHKWCYDYEGLERVFKEVGEFKNIRELKLDDKLANIPFTHNRPEEDVCIIAQKK